MEDLVANYYPYFSEIEEHFVRKRQKNLLISPLDWSLIASWKESGIPLQVVMRGIDRSFESYDARSRKASLVNSLFYCQQSVQECFAEFGDSQIGAHDPQETGQECYPREEMQHLFGLWIGSFQQAAAAAENEGMPRLSEDLQKAASRLQALQQEVGSEFSLHLNRMERDLQTMDHDVAQAILAATGEEMLGTWRHEAEKELRPYKKRVQKEMYEKILKNYLFRCARQRFGIPPLTIHSF